MQEVPDGLSQDRVTLRASGGTGHEKEPRGLPEAGAVEVGAGQALQPAEMVQVRGQQRLAGERDQGRGGRLGKGRGRIPA